MMNNIFALPSLDKKIIAILASNNMSGQELAEVMGMQYDKLAVALTSLQNAGFLSSGFNTSEDCYLARTNPKIYADRRIYELNREKLGII